VNALVERGWVAKEPDPADARGSLVRLTLVGRKTLTAARRANGAAVAEWIAAGNVSASDLTTTVAVLRTILESTKDD
jgi:DNA-binding MarR family transcriptional regulator